MSTPPTTAAVAKATGGAGATRTCLELAATLARDGRSVALLDADFATQGLASHVPGRLEDDLTGVLTEECSLDDALVDLEWDVEGRVAAAPARAPFERLARAKTPDAAQRLEDAIAEAAGRYGFVLVDTPPVSTNPAVGAVTATDRVAAVTPATARGADGLQRVRARLEDVGAAPGIAIATGGTDGHPVEGADVTLPNQPADLAAVPTCLDPEHEYAPAVASAAEALFGLDLDLEFEESGLLPDGLR